MQPRIFNIHSEKKHHISRLMAPINGLKREIQNTQLLVNTVLSFADEPIQEDILEQPIATQYQKSQKGLLECQNSMMSSLAILEEVLALHSCQNIMDDIQSSINYLSSKFDKKLIKIFVNSDYYKRIKDLTHLNNLEINNIVDRINQLCINLQEKEQDKFSFRSSYKELLSLLNKLHKMFGQSQENELEQSTISTVHLLMNELSQLPVDKNYKVPNNIKKVCDQLIGCINQLEKLVNFLTPITTDKLEEKTHEASEHSEQIKQPVLASEEKEEKENVEPSSEILLSTTITKPVDCWVKNDKGNEVLALTRTYQEMLCVVDQLVDQQRLTSDQEKIQSLKEQEIILKKLIELDTSQCSPDDLKYLHKKDELDVWFSSKKDRPYNPMPEIALPKDQNEIMYVIKNALSLKYTISCKIAGLKLLISDPSTKIEVDRLRFQEKRLGLIANLYIVKLKETMPLSEYKRFKEDHQSWLKGLAPVPQEIGLPKGVLCKAGYFKTKSFDSDEGIKALIERRKVLQEKLKKADSSKYPMILNKKRKRLEVEFISEIIKNYDGSKLLLGVINDVITKFEEKGKSLDFLIASKVFKNKTEAIINKIATCYER